MLNREKQKAILSYVQGLLKARLTGAPDPVLAIESEMLKEKRGIFVTLKHGGRLRGCIGQIVGVEPLKKSIGSMAQAAAFQDPRFPPLELDELKDLQVHISFLTPPVPVQSYRDIRTGTDGIIVTYGRKKGVYLPEVATETGWDSKTFFESCAREKAGLTEAELLQASIEVFQTEGFEN